MGEPATALTGGHVDVSMFDFSFRETLGFRPNIYLTEYVARVRGEFEKYLEGSGFPEFSKFGPRIVISI